MIIGAHVLLYSRDPEADRAFFRDVLGFPHVDVGHGWLIFKLPPGETAVHPVDDDDTEQTHAGHRLLGAVLYLMCDDLEATLSDLKSKHVQVSDVSEQRWGMLASLILPGGGKIGIYEPKHRSLLHA